MSDMLVFTDLDGTLLDHHDYSYDAALPTLRRLKKANIPLIFNTSKTAAEVEEYMEIEFEIDRLTQQHRWECMTEEHTKAAELDPINPDNLLSTGDTNTH